MPQKPRPRFQPVDHEPLRELATGTTPGPWITDTVDGSIDIITEWQNDSGSHVVICEGANEDAEYMAAVHPEKVLELISEIEKLRKSLKDQKETMRLERKKIQSHLQRLDNLTRHWRKELTERNRNPGRVEKLVSLENIVRLARNP